MSLLEALLGGLAGAQRKTVDMMREATDQGWPVYMAGQKTEMQLSERRLLVAEDMAQRLVRGGIVKIAPVSRKGSPGPRLLMKE